MYEFLASYCVLVGENKGVITRFCRLSIVQLLIWELLS